MFVNKPAERHTVDEERGVELRFLGAGPDRPGFYTLTVAGRPIGFEAKVRSVDRPGGERVLVWTVRDVGIGDPLYRIPGHRFANATDRAAVLVLIDEALRAYRDLYGMDVTAVGDVLFEPVASET